MSQKSTILLTIDSLRSDFCGYTTRGRSDLTPTLTRVADEGISFTQAVAPGPRTPSSVPTLYTGIFHQYRDGRPDRTWQYRHGRIGEFVRRHRTIAEEMRERGFSTAAVTMNPWTTTDTCFDRGFEEFVDLERSGSDLFSDRPMLAAVERAFGSDWLSDRTPWSSQKYWFVQWHGIYPLIQNVLERLSEPYFLWIFLLDCHLPYIAPRQFRTEQSTLGTMAHLYKYGRWVLTDYELTEQDAGTLVRGYRDAVRSTDRFLGRLLEDIRESDDDPALVFHSDHGEGLGEHGSFSHQRELYEENLRVPLVVYNTDQQATIDEQVSLRSVPDIVRDVSAGSFDPHGVTDEWVLSQTEFGDSVSLRGNGWKYIREEDTEELYDLRGDPSEQSDLSDERPELLRELCRLVEYRLADQHERTAHYRAVSELGEI